MSFWSSKKEFEDSQKTDIQILELQARFRNLWDSLPLALCAVNSSGTIIDANMYFCRLIDYSLSGIINKKTLASLFSEQSRVEEIIANSFLGQMVSQGEEFNILNYSKQLTSVSFYSQYIKESGVVFVSFVNLEPIKLLKKDMEAQIKERTLSIEQSRIALLNMLEDTEEARLKTEEEKAKTETIFANFMDGLMVFNLKEQIELINDQAERFLGIKRNNYIDKSFSELKRNEIFKILLEIIGNEMRPVFRKELVVSPDLVLEITADFIVADKKKLSFLIILHNVTRERAIEELKSQFVSVAAHQLRTPLSIIKWGVGMVLAGDLGHIAKGQKDLLDKTYQTNERMIKLVNDLLNVSKIEEGRYLYQPKIVNIEELLKQIYDSLKPVADHKKLKFKLIIEKSEKDKLVKLDVEKMELAIKNLVDNAMHYTSSGGAVDIKLSRTDNKIDLEVKDTGVGIPAKQQERVFSRFFRATNVVKMETDGTGLGLFITKNIVEAHGGKITFKSQENKGTSFFISLPAAI